MKRMLLLLITLSMAIGGLDVGIAAAVDRSSINPVVNVELKVPPETVLYGTMPRMVLEISPNADMGVVAIQAVRSPSNPWSMPDVMVADLTTGQLSRVAALLGKSDEEGMASCMLSQDRSHLLVNWMTRRGTNVYAIKLPNGSPIEVAQGKVMAVWAGDLVAVSTMTETGTLASISLVDPSTGQSRQLPVCGMVAVGLPDGTILIGGDPKAPEKAVSVEAATEQGRLLHIDATGKLLADIAPIGILSSPPMVSTNGKFIAFQSKPANAPEGPDTRYGFTILSLDGTARLELPTPHFPIAVMDNGAAVVMHGGSDENNTAPLYWVSSDGQVVKELVHAVSAAVIGESLIYASNSGGPTIRTMPLPEE